MEENSAWAPWGDAVENAEGKEVLPQDVAQTLYKVLQSTNS